MQKDVVKLIRETLQYMGCDPGVVGNISGRSPVVFNFNNELTLHLSMEAGNKLLWTEIGEYSEHLMDQCGAKILRLLLESFPCFVTRKLFLTHTHGRLYLQADIDEAALESAQTFATALQLFFERAVMARQIVRE